MPAIRTPKNRPHYNLAATIKRIACLRQTTVTRQIVLSETEYRFFRDHPDYHYYLSLRQISFITYNSNIYTAKDVKELHRAVSTGELCYPVDEN
jgi:hypothetical protein